MARKGTLDLTCDESAQNYRVEQELDNWTEQDLINDERHQDGIPEMDRPSGLEFTDEPDAAWDQPWPVRDDNHMCGCGSMLPPEKCHYRPILTTLDGDDIPE